eukprot:m.59597 g.59597  ORF g.59597 m.59597 type:complete len:74 (-) comp19114_c0_seq6:34-255(-)
MKAVLDEPELYHSNDPFQSLTINSMRQDEYLHWHFDNNDFAITLCLQEPEAGGALEFVPNIRCKVWRNRGFTC